MQQNLRKQSFLAFSLSALCLAVACGGGGGLTDDGDGGEGGFGTGGIGGIAGEGGAAGGTGGFFTGGTGGFFTGGAGGGSTCFSGAGGTCGSGAFCDFPDGTCGRLSFIVAADVPTSSGGSSGARPNPGQFPGAPAPPPGNVGFCQAKPKECAAIFAPVCGCDGNTYGNDCERAAKGVSKMSDGPCENPIRVVGEGEDCGKFMPGLELVCGKDLFCETDARACRAPSAKGSCRRKPSQCIPVNAPVCGCDGKTYDNDCMRRQAGASLANTGACGPVGAQLGEACGDAIGTSCAQGLLCDPEPNQCTTGRFVGICRAQPGDGCTKEFSPVCGCDGRTYSNDCMRLKAGIGKDREGECRVTRLIQAGSWGGPSALLTVMDAKSGGEIQFDCGRASIAGPLEIDANGNFTWRGKYVFTGGSGGAAQPVAPPAREVILTGSVGSGGMHIKMTVQVVGSMTTTTLSMQLGGMATFSTCL